MPPCRRSASTVAGDSPVPRQNSARRTNPRPARSGSSASPVSMAECLTSADVVHHLRHVRTDRTPLQGHRASGPHLLGLRGSRPTRRKAWPIRGDTPGSLLLHRCARRVVHQTRRRRIGSDHQRNSTVGGRRVGSRSFGRKSEFVRRCLPCGPSLGALRPRARICIFQIARLGAMPGYATPPPLWRLQD